MQTNTNTALDYPLNKKEFFVLVQTSGNLLTGFAENFGGGGYPKISEIVDFFALAYKKSVKNLIFHNFFHFQREGWGYPSRWIHLSE